MSNITVYGSATCIPCKNTKRWLDRHGVGYNYIDITKSPEGFNLISSLGYQAIPVIVAGEQHWQGFDVEKLNALLH